MSSLLLELLPPPTPTTYGGNGVWYGDTDGVNGDGNGDNGVGDGVGVLMTSLASFVTPMSSSTTSFSKMSVSPATLGLLDSLIISYWLIIESIKAVSKGGLVDCFSRPKNPKNLSTRLKLELSTDPYLVWYWFFKNSA